jgi:hypothetical protein
MHYIMVVEKFMLLENYVNLFKWIQYNDAN